MLNSELRKREAEIILAIVKCAAALPKDARKAEAASLLSFVKKVVGNKNAN